MKALILASGVSAYDELSPDLSVNEAATRVEEDTALWWFSYKDVLGKHGYRYMPLGAQLALAATRAAEPFPGGSPDRSLWVATSTYGPAIHEIFNTMSFDSGPESIGPATAPYFSANLLGARVAEEYNCQAGACMFSDSVAASFHALEAAIVSLDRGRGGEALVVAAEAPTENIKTQRGGGQFGAALLLANPYENNHESENTSMLTIECLGAIQSESTEVDFRIGNRVFTYSNASCIMRLIAWANSYRKAFEAQVRLRRQNLVIALHPRQDKETS